MLKKIKFTFYTLFLLKSDKMLFLSFPSMLKVWKVNFVTITYFVICSKHQIFKTMYIQCILYIIQFKLNKKITAIKYIFFCWKFQMKIYTSESSECIFKKKKN